MKHLGRSSVSWVCTRLDRLLRFLFDVAIRQASCKFASLLVNAKGSKRSFNMHSTIACERCLLLRKLIAALYCLIVQRNVWPPFCNTRPLTDFAFGKKQRSRSFCTATPRPIGLITNKRCLTFLNYRSLIGTYSLHCDVNFSAL